MTADEVVAQSDSDAVATLDSATRSDRQHAAMQNISAVSQVRILVVQVKFLKAKPEPRLCTWICQSPTEQNLVGVLLALQDFSPYVNSSVDRITQFCDHVGVTDRYTGYR